MPWYRRLIKKLASMELAVLIIASIAVIIAIGTVVESKYDAWTAKNLVYSSIWMYLALGALVTSLIAVIADRWPWKPRHASFIFAHVGIIILIYGSLLTQIFGIDGTIRLAKTDGPVKEVTVQETDLIVYRSPDGSDYEKIYSEEVNFLKKPVTSDKPVLIKSRDLNFEILESIPYSLPKLQVEASPQPQSGAAVRFQLANPNVSQVDWLVQRNVFEKVEAQVGPVLMTLGGLWDRNKAINEIRFTISEKGALSYALYAKDSATPFKQGLAKEGDLVETGWMGLQLRILRYLPKAVQKYELTRLDHPVPGSSPSLRVRYNGQESYLFLNDYVKVFTENRVYLVSYQNRRLPLGFEISLDEFKKTDYPGTMRAMAYQSSVEYDGGNKALISMNEPLKYKKFYFYQASFEEGPNGLVKASILSVNHDPGRVWKYLGSAVMCLGIVLLFYFRKRKAQ
ncbi:MAG: hypothetical protein OM95_00365 [Bdellovibrio sp. ArHS]|uniref:cytochrome c biogenesis protein ResB n=1 Tax=Bdellovibrio sp. ArHS TaxID=1569284 RepID=UPI0005830C58|nr:cytochrome c biogenesis protein ResB [Bdellovibrio sp. ArHS]KHD90016.1 MAG: hypothetical protein OM95_00365 [Bdellovibrio sp. ArHS]